MCARLLGFLLFIWQIILNGSSVIPTNHDSVKNGTPSTVQTAGLPLGYHGFPDVHAAYRVHERGSTWYEARDRCIAEGAKLAIADSVVKIEHINSLKTPSFKWTHVGIYRSNSTREWVRIDDGVPVTSLPWLASNPDNFGHCVGISLHENALSNYPCVWEEWFVCEIPI